MRGHFRYTMSELMALQNDIQQINFDENSIDTWTFIWGNSQYTSSSFYRLAFRNSYTPRTFKWIWKSKCIPMLKFFAWLILLDRLNTKDMIRRRNFHVQPNAHCVMCTTSVEEDVNHLFFCCPFATSCCHKLGIQWTAANNIHDKILGTSRRSNILFFMEIFLIASWEIWNLRNSIIFYNGGPTIRLWI